jgi:hypothetical protein
MVFGAAGATQTPKIDDFRPAQKSCMKNPSVRGFCINALTVSDCCADLSFPTATLLLFGRCRSMIEAIPVFAK